MLNEFKNFSKDRSDLDDCVALSAFGRALKAEYETNKVEVPEWLTSQLGVLQREIKVRSEEAREAKRSKLRSQLDQLKTPSERKADLQSQLDALSEPQPV